MRRCFYCSDDMESSNENEQEKKKVNDDLVVFMRKRSEQEAPRYSARLKTYVDIHRKRRRATAARRFSENRVSHKVSHDSVKGKNEDNAKVETKTVGVHCAGTEPAVVPVEQITMARSFNKIKSERSASEDSVNSRKYRNKPPKSGSVSESVSYRGLFSRQQHHEDPKHGRSISRSHSYDPSDRGCGKRKKRRRSKCRKKKKKKKKKCGKKKRKRSCSRKRKRKPSCKRKKKKRRC